MNIWAGLLRDEPTTRRRDNSDCSQDVIEALEAGPATRKQIAIATGRPLSTVYSTLARMESAVHVCDTLATGPGWRKKENVYALRDLP